MHDIDIARRYITKVDYARAKGIKFSLNFYEYKRLVTAKKCRYTGIDLTHTASNTGAKIPTYVTIDRIENSIGYVTGNVVPCCHAYNSFKAMIENPNNIITFDMVLKAAKLHVKLMERANESI